MVLILSIEGWGSTRRVLLPCLGLRCQRREEEVIALTKHSGSQRLLRCCNDYN